MGFIRTLLVIAITGGLLALAAGFIGPVFYDLDVLSYFRPHISLALGVGALMLFFLGAKKASIFAFSAMLLGVAMLGPVWRPVPMAPAQLSATSLAPPPTNAAACNAPSIRIATANLLYPRTADPAAAEALAAVDADILVTQETTEVFWSAAGELLTRYPYRIARLRIPQRVYSVVLWSKFPINNPAESSMSDTNPIYARGVIELGDGAEIGVLGVHVAWPVISRQEGQIKNLDTLVETLPKTRVVLGDFNAAPWSHAMSLAEELTDTRIVGGGRLTWRGRYPSVAGIPSLPAILGNQIDHILVSDDVLVEAVDTFGIPNSDHWGVVATVRAPCVVATP